MVLVVYCVEEIGFLPRVAKGHVKVCLEEGFANAI